MFSYRYLSHCVESKHSTAVSQRGITGTSLLHTRTQISQPSPDWFCCLSSHSLKGSLMKSVQAASKKSQRTVTSSASRVRWKRDFSDWLLTIRSQTNQEWASPSNGTTHANFTHGTEQLSTCCTSSSKNRNHFSVRLHSPKITLSPKPRGQNTLHHKPHVPAVSLVLMLEFPPGTSGSHRRTYAQLVAGFWSELAYRMGKKHK